MLDVMSLRKNSLGRREDFFSPILKNFLDDEDFLSTVQHMHKSFKVDLKETEEQYIIEADLPGIKKENIDINFDNNYLIISARREDCSQNQNENYVRQERYYGELKRSFYIENVDEKLVEASFEDGVLKVKLPKIVKKTDRIRKIDIN